MSFTQTENSQHSLTPIVYEGSAGPVGGKSTGVGLRLGVGPETTLAEALSPHDARKTQLRHVKTSRAATAHDVNAGQCRANTHQHAIILYPSFPLYD